MQNVEELIRQQYNLGWLAGYDMGVQYSLSVGYQLFQATVIVGLVLAVYKLYQKKK